MELDFKNYVYYFCDTETSNLNADKGEIIELSFNRLNDNVKKTWYIRATRPEGIDPGALKVNHHKLEDILHQTPEGRKKYQDLKVVINEVEEFLAEDASLSEDRIFIAYNAIFDYEYIRSTYKRLNMVDIFPFGRRIIDVMQIEFFIDLARNEVKSSYSLANSIKSYGIKNGASHTASGDTEATKQLFLKQLDRINKI